MEAGSSATLPPRPLSTSVDAEGEFIYDRLPETLPRRPPKAVPPIFVPPVVSCMHS